MSLLTSTSFKGRFFYIGTVILFTVIAAFYLLYLKDPSAKKNLEKQSLFFNYSALKNGIRLISREFFIKSNQKGLTPQQKTTAKNLIFNQNGFPVSGINVAETQQTPQTKQDCRIIWQNSLGPFQPKLLDQPQKNHYWVNITSNNLCIYGATNINDRQISYNSVNGEVKLLTIND